MNENEFSRMKAAAVEQMRQMNARSEHVGNERRMPPTPAFVRTPGQNRERAQMPPPPPPPKPPERPSISGFFEGLDLPFLDRLKSEGDFALILGLLLILFSEKADKRLLFALLYILL